MKKLSIILLITSSIFINNTFAQKPTGGVITNKTEKYTPIPLPKYGWGALNFENSNMYEYPENVVQENTSSSLVCATPTDGVPTLYNFSSHKMTTNLSASLLSVSKFSLKDSKIIYFNQQRRWGMKDFASASIGKEIFLIGGRRLQGTPYFSTIK
jgi:hypothetical protein